MSFQRGGLADAAQLLSINSCPGCPVSLRVLYQHTDHGCHRLAERVVVPEPSKGHLVPDGDTNAIDETGW
jgi:hypothetical protein